MTDFNITLNEDQIDRLAKAGFAGLAEEPENLLFYFYNVLEKLVYHNKNYTKDQFCSISDLYDISNALYKGF